MRVACDLGYPCAKFRLPRPFGFRVRADVRDIRQTDRRTDGRTTDADHRLMPPPLRGGGIIKAQRKIENFTRDEDVHIDSLIRYMAYVTMRYIVLSMAPADRYRTKK